MAPALSLLLPTTSLFCLFALLSISRVVAHDILPLRSSLTVEAFQTDMLQSSDGTFSCGFYNIYTNAFTFSIWYSKAANKTVVWSANRDRPVHVKRSTLALQRDGNMVLRDYDGTVVWQAGSNFRNVQYAQLLNTGNFILKDTNGKTIWQSFDSPTDTFLPTQRITASTKLVPTTQSPVPGNYIFRFSDLSVLSLIYDTPEASDIYWPDPDQTLYQDNRNQYNNTRLGMLDNNGSFGSSDFADGQPLVASDAGPGIKRRLTLDPDGNLRLYSLNESDGSWKVSMVALSLACNVHGVCGPNGICHYSPKPACSCAPGYVMRNPGNWTEGCRAIFNITCDNQEPMKFVRLPQTDFWGSDQRHIRPVSLHACKRTCMGDCTCKGFQYQEDTGSCYPKAGLFSGRTYPSTDVRTIYLKLPAKVIVSSTTFRYSDVFDSAPPSLDCNQMSSILPNLEVHNNGVEESKWFYFYGFIVAIFVVEVSFIAFAWFFVLGRELRPSEIWAAEEGYKVMTSHFRRYSYGELVKATIDFKVEIGRGSSGVVYKGVLEDERPVALKKLEHISRGKEEFQAELSVIARIYHMNLVRIWGFCSEGSHRLLVCEYIENGSLASILFSDKNNISLDWKQRFNIALGVAKGLAYLHHECLEWVIHCDVKPENILLDKNFEPKITDFGLAKLLSRGGSSENTSHVRGTTGYIAPEWISGLPITSKVDVYSYGVVLLEFLSGSRVSELTVGSDADDEDIPTTPLPPSLIDEDEPAVKLKSNEVRIGPITRARAKLLKQQVSRGDEHRTRSRGAAGQEDGREAGHGAGHEDISWTREGGAGGMRERRRRRPGRSSTRSDRPPDRPTRSPTRSTGRQTGRGLSYRIKTGNPRKYPVDARLTGPQTGLPGCRPVDRTPDRPIRSLARLTGFQTGPVRVCLDQIYSGSVIFVLFRPEVVLDAYISPQDAPLAALDHV